DDGVATTDRQTVTLEGLPIDVKHGYATNISIILAAQLSSEFTTDPAGTVGLGTCSFTYTEATNSLGAEISEITNTGTDTDGC
ncbi:MAG TPA: hypothetical protein VIC02_01790, partial [Kineobactrum sp.]